MGSSSECALGQDARSWLAGAGKVASVSRSESSRLDQRFPRSCRLTARRQYLAVYGRGHRVGCKSLTLFGLANTLGVCRLGITVTRKSGGATRRNRIKRLLREVFRRHRDDLPHGIDVVVNVRPGSDTPELRRYEQELVDGIRRLSVRVCGR